MRDETKNGCEGDYVKWQTALVILLSSDTWRKSLPKFRPSISSMEKILFLINYKIKTLCLILVDEPQTMLFCDTDKFRNSSHNSVFFDSYCMVRIFYNIIRYASWKYCQYLEKSDTAVIYFWTWTQNIFHWQTEGDVPAKE